MAQEGEVTVVGQGARLEGTIVSAGSLRIDGLQPASDYTLSVTARDDFGFVLRAAPRGAQD